MKLVFLTAACLLGLFLNACATAKNTTNANVPSTGNANTLVSSTPIPNSTPSYDTIALDKAKARFAEYFGKCGDSYITRINNAALGPWAVPNLKEYRGVTFSIGDRKDITDADRLNGIEWAASVYADFQATREHDGMHHGWGQWTPPGQGPAYRYAAVIETIKLTSGGWNIRYSASKEKVDCSKIQNKLASGEQIDASDFMEANDLSLTYGKQGNVIFNKKTSVVFRTPAEFFEDSGQRSFKGLKFDEAARVPPSAKWPDGRGLDVEDYRKINN